MTHLWLTIRIRIREARRQLNDTIGELRDPIVVGGHDHDPPWGGELAKKPKDALHLDVVEVGRRLVGEDQRRVMDEGARDRHTLLLPAGHLGRPMIGAVRQTYPLEELARPCLCTGSWHAKQAHGHDHVAARSQACDQVEGLEHHPDGLPAVGSQGTSPEVGDPDIPQSDLPGGRREKARKTREQRRLATPRWPQYYDKLAILGDEAHPVERLDHIATRVEADG